MKKDVLKDIEPGQTKYVVRLTNGDLITGVVVELVSDKKEGPELKLKLRLERQ